MYDEHKLHVKPWRHQRRVGRWATVMGWACILLPVLGASVLFVSENAAITIMIWALFAIPRVGPVAGLIMVVLAGFCIGGGVCLLQRKAKARRVLLWYAKGVLVIQGLTIFCLLAQRGPEVIVGHALGAPVTWVLIPSIVSVIWPVFMLIWLNWPGTKEEVDAWPGGRCRGKGLNPEEKGNKG